MPPPDGPGPTEDRIESGSTDDDRTEPVTARDLLGIDPSMEATDDLGEAIDWALSIPDPSGDLMSDETPWIVPRLNHDESRSVTPRVRAGYVYYDAGSSNPVHARYFAAQLLAAADASDPANTLAIGEHSVTRLEAFDAAREEGRQQGRAEAIALLRDREAVIQWLARNRMRFPAGPAGMSDRDLYAEYLEDRREH